MSKEFDNILDECLERLLSGGETIEQCLERYPEQAADLEPLLQTALATREAVTIQPRAEFKARARYQFHSALQEATFPKRHFSLNWLPRWATVVTIVLGVLMMGGGTVAAAAYSMPDSFLYPFKLATEQVQLAFTFSDTGKAELNAEFADRRVTEIIYLAGQGDAERVEVTTQRLNEQLITLASLTATIEMVATAEVTEAPPTRSEEGSTAPMLQVAEAESVQDTPGVPNHRIKLRTTIISYAVNHPAYLQAALEEAPESTRSALRHAINITEAGYEKALEGWD